MLGIEEDKNHQLHIAGVNNPDELYSFLCDNGIIVRNRNRVEKCAGCLRITIGTKEENAQLINAIKDYERK